MRLVFIATGDIALPAFRRLLVDGPRPLALITQPDKPVGRHQQMTRPAIKTEALEAGIPVWQPETNGDVADQLAALEPEVIVVMAYGQILRSNVLDIASHAIINLHASLLPKYRGAACIQAAIDAGDSVTGITAQHVVKKLDAGDVILSKSIPIHHDETGGSLHDRLADLAVEVMAETLQQLADGTAPRIPQDEASSSYISKLERDQGRLDWSMSAVDLERRIRAYDPWPGTFTMTVQGGKESRLKIFPPTRVADIDLAAGQVMIENDCMWVGTGKGALELTVVQAEGSRKMAVEEYLRAKLPERLV
jgi:methionyl-tRNA formyltransferase